MEVINILGSWLVDMKLISKIDDVIKGKGLQKKWVASQVGVSATQLSQWCKNVDGQALIAPKSENLFLLAKVLNCSVYDLYDIEEE